MNRFHPWRIDENFEHWQGLGQLRDAAGIKFERNVFFRLPLRIGLPVALLFPLAWWSTTALLAGLVAFGVVERIAVRRAVGGERA